MLAWYHPWLPHPMLTAGSSNVLFISRAMYTLTTPVQRGARCAHYIKTGQNRQITLHTTRGHAHHTPCLFKLKEIRNLDFHHNTTTEQTCQGADLWELTKDIEDTLPHSQQ